LASRLLGTKKPAEPVERRGQFQRSSVARKAGVGGRKLEVRFRDKRVIKGTTYKLDVNSLGFYLVPLEPADEDRIFVYFSDLTAIYFVRGFDERSDMSASDRESSVEGQEVKIAFPDGEIIEGRTLHRFDPSCQRFFIVPKEGMPNVVSILVEMSSLKGIEMEGFKRGTFAEPDETVDIEEDEKKGKGRAPLSQNESMGDLYFSMKNYDSALAEYEKVREEYPEDKRLKVKISVCNFNRGVNFIKSRKYVEAKAEFEKIGEDDPVYSRAKKKIRKINKILKEVETMGT
jgi:tetratricopeptide (TPR) repeat protein